MKSISSARISRFIDMTRLIAASAAASAILASSSVAIAGTASEDLEMNSRKTVLITGANRGLGLEFARQYAAEGWTVIGTARRPDGANDLNGLDVEVLPLDVADAESVAGLAKALDGRPIDLLINNAGIFPRVNTLAEVDFDDVARTYAVNTIGPMRVTRALLPNLRLGGAKQVVSITSGLGSIENNTSGRYYGYRESKAALNMFNRSLSAELNDEGFTCIVMSPGWVQTDMGGPAANLTPEESITGMKKVIDTLISGDNGTYRNWDGGAVPW